MFDMTTDVFATQPFGVLALQKMASRQPVPENFRLYYAGWLGDHPEDFDVMEVRGAEFRKAKSGPNKGELCIKVSGTDRKAFVTKQEMKAQS